MYCLIFFSFDSSMMYLPVRLFICPVSPCNSKILLLIWRALRWNCGRVYSSPGWKDMTRSWDLGPIPPSWGLTENKTTIIRSNPLSLFMYVTSLTCDLGDFYKGMMLSLIRWYLSALENDLYFSFAAKILGCVSGGRRMEYMLWCFSLRDLYAGQIFFVDKYWY